MANTANLHRMYEDLADMYDRQGQAKLRDWFLVLAADAAFTVGMKEPAERLRSRLLKENPHHLLKPFTSFSEALNSPDIQSYIGDLRRAYPPESADQLLRTHKPNSGTSPLPEPVKAKQEKSAIPMSTSSALPKPERPAPRREPVLDNLDDAARDEPPVFRMNDSLPEPPAKQNHPKPQKLIVGRNPLPARKPNPYRTPSPTPDWNRQETSPLANKAEKKLPKFASPEEEVSRASGIVSGFLFLVIFLAGASLLAYSLVKPFLPAGWLEMGN